MHRGRRRGPAGVRKPGDPTVTDAAIQAQGLVRTFGETVALDGVDLVVPEGRVVGLLGPNGAGKTTTVRILTTLLAPDSGRATVAGHDVREDPEAVRSVIGLSGQFAAIDDHLTGRENLVMVGELYQLRRDVAQGRADELLERFDLVDAAGRPVRGYSGGMRRRLDLAASIVGRPQVLFLDEPTTGLDPRSRRAMWEVIRELVSGGATLLLTTQYLEEADVLADRIVLIDHGRVIAEGTADELKSQVGGQVLEIRVSSAEDLEEARRQVADLTDAEINIREAERSVLVPVGRDVKLFARAVERLTEAGIEMDDVGLHKPTLDDVFFSLTGGSPDEVRTGSRQDGGAPQATADAAGGDA
ncbi:MAG: ATP-binding cassette domain-containing protein [Actinobacteria bacterium]|nr:ATP-binding cassette domain-containing protein [Actinomycetota bacterium]